MGRWGRVLAGSALALLFADAALAQNFQSMALRTGSGGAFSVTGGMADITANEYVVDGADRLSQLVWSSRAFVIRADLAQRRNRLVLAGGLSFGFGGNSSMIDQDWIAPFAIGDGWDDWSDRSVHDDTSLDRYIDGYASVGFNVVQRQRITATFRGGFRYTDVSWTARGGSFTYSDKAFRDTEGDFPDGTEVVTYRQQLPSGFIGLAVGSRLGRLTFAGEAEIGRTVMARATDEHLLRDLVFVDHLDPARTIHLGASVAYAFSGGFSLILRGTSDRMDLTGGDTVVTDTTTDTDTDEPGAAGADFAAIGATMGFRFTY